MEREGSHLDPRTPNNRLGRLLKQRELRKYVRSSSLSQGSKSGESERSEGNGVAVSQTKESPASDHGKTEKKSAELQRLLVVSNRLPVSASRNTDGTWNLESTSGGLVSALIGVNVFEAKWIGWPGVCLIDEAEKESLTSALAEKDCVPVFLDEETFNQYYNGYCNNILWPLFHYLGLPQEDRLSTTQGFKTQFDAYKKANQIFADVVNTHYKEGDVVWCHDYHLMYLPKCLKDYDKNMKVGWFLHTPFPSSELHRTLPARAELLRAVLEANIIGFHTYDYARHFVSSCTRVLGLECTPEGVEHQGRLTRVVAYPIGMDANKFTSAIESPTTKHYIEKLKQRYAGRKVMLGVDRLDMVKGIPQKLLAFEKFLEENPEWRDKVVLIQIAIPTRTDVPEYQKLASQVHEMVGRINGRFGSLSGAPINHLDCTLDFQHLCALYAITDVVLVTSLRDGMNLVSYEFVACQNEKKGVLILSEFAGAAQSLGAGAILVNPWNVVQVSAAIRTALNMSDEEKEKRHLLNYMHVTTHSSREWAEMFVGELNDSIIEAQVRTTQIPPSLPVGLAVEKYLESANRLLILGFNATLTQSVERGDQINDMELKLHPELKEPLRKLCNDPNTTVLVLSGSPRTVLDDNFGEFNMWLAAENGMFLRHTSDDWLTVLPECADMDWVQSIKQVFEYFTERTPRSCLEVRATSLVWNYKYSDVEFGRIQAKDLLQHLKSGQISSSPIEVLQGARSVEVRAAGLSKGAAIDRILGQIVYKNGIEAPINYVLCVGHFLGKDEDIYSFFEPTPDIERGTLSLIRCLSRAQPAGGWIAPSSDETKAKHAHPGDEECLTVLDLRAENYFSCSVGRIRSNARYLTGSSDEVVALLKEMAAQLLD